MTLREPRRPHRLRVVAVLLWSLILSPGSASAAPRAEGALYQGVPRVAAELLLHPDDHGSARRIAVALDIAPGWHVYWKNPGDSGLPTLVEGSVEGGTLQPFRWPTPDVFFEMDGALRTYGYEGSVLLTSVAVAGPGEGPEHVAVEIELAACRESCIPATLRLDRSFADLGHGAGAEEVRRRFAAASGTFPVAPTLAGYRIEPYVSQSAVRPGDAVELGFAVRDFRNDATSFTDEPHLAGDEVVFFSEVATGLELEPASVDPHPKDPEALWVSIRGRAIEGQWTEGATLRGVLRVGAAEHRRGLRLELPVAYAPPGADVRITPAPFAGAALPTPSIAALLLLALLGGLMLNLMPCVLPILALKAFAVVEIAERERRTALAHGLAYTVGVVASMLALALVVIVVQRLGHAVGWGFQFQEPAFVVAVGALLVVFAMNLFGVFEIPAPGAMARWGSQAVGCRRSFFEGLLAVVLSTPCSAPFLGTAVGAALSGRASLVVAVFLFVGLGLALPFLVVSALPRLAGWLPRPGSWMPRLRTGLGFLLLGSVSWLIWILGRSAGADVAAATLAGFVALAFLVWLVGLAQRGELRALVPTLVASALVFFSAGPGAIRVDRELPTLPFDEFDPSSLQQALDEGRHAFVYFTADWCVTCKVNESRVLKDPEVVEGIARSGAAVFRADFTRRDPELLRTMQRHGRAGVPLYLVFDPRRPAEPAILPDLLSKEQVLRSLPEAGGRAADAAHPGAARVHLEGDARRGKSGAA